MRYEILTSDQIRNTAIDTSKAWETGIDARRRLKDISGNPYEPDQLGHWSWRRGWIEQAHREHTQAGLSLDDSSKLLKRLGIDDRFVRRDY